MKIGNMDIKEKISRLKITYKHVLGLGLGVLAFSYLLVLLVDIFNVLGLRGLPGGIVPFFWDSLFAERRLIEFTQWTMLTGLIILSYRMFKGFSERKEILEARFWLIIAFTGTLMLIEDALNPRHFLFRQVFELHWQQINVAETIYFGSLAAIPSYAFLRYGKKIREHRKTLILLVIGGLFYGTAVAISGPGHSFGVTALGEAGLDITASIGGEELREAYELSNTRLIELHGEETDDLAFRFTDHFIEESLELIGATFLLASAASYMETLRKREE